MVRLRREIEGVRRNHAAPRPAYALDAQTSAAAMPPLDAWLLAQEPCRVALAGSVRRDLAEALAREGHWVTVADLEEDELRRWHAAVSPDVASHLTLLARPYGDVSFGPASFDRVVLFDALAAYQEPGWIIHKACRELKPDGLLAVREAVRGRLPESWASLGRGYAPTRLKVLQALLASAPKVLAGRAGSWMLEPAALDAIERGAHLDQSRFALDASGLQEAVAAALTIEQTWIGHSAHLSSCALPWGAKPALRRMALGAMQQTPILADVLDAGLPLPRVVGLVARRSLRGPGFG